MINWIKSKVKLIRKKVKRFWRWILVGGAGIALAASLVPQDIPEELKLKVPKERIISSQEEGNYVRYFYGSLAEVPLKKYGKTSFEIKNKIDEINSRLDVEIFQAQTKKKEDELKRQKLNYDEIYDNPDENLTQRTKNSYTFVLGKTRDGKTIKETSFFGGRPFVKAVADNLWYQTEIATTTIDAFNQQMASGFFERLAGIMGTAHAVTDTFYPDPAPGVTTVDGMARRDSADEIWATIRAGAGVSAAEGDAATELNTIYSSATTNQWQQLTRTFFLFDTSSIPDTNDISAAVLSLYGSAKNDSLAITPDVDIYTSTPASNVDLVAADYSQVQSVSQTGSPITYANWSTTGYNDFTFNATGRGNISKTGVSKFAARNANYDVSGTPPAWSSATYAYMQANFAEQTGTANDPKLVVTHAEAAAMAEAQPKIIIIEE